MSEKARERTALRLTISTVPQSDYTTSHIPLRATFVNASGEQIRLLRHFEPIPVFFAFEMVDDRGRSVSIPGAGKIDFARDAMRYADIPPGRSLTVDMDLAEAVAYPDEVEPGRFTISATYHNQYGDDCFHGCVESEPIEAILVETAEPRVGPGTEPPRVR